MILKLINFLILLMVLSSCKTNKEEISIKGRAYNNSKNGAYIQTKKGEYYIDGIEIWEDKYFEREILVKGKLSIIYDTVYSNTVGSEFYQASGKIKIIKSAKYRITLFGHTRKRENFRSKTKN